MGFFRSYKKQLFRILVIILAVVAFISVGKKSKATIFDSALGAVITPIQKGLSDITGWFTTRLTAFGVDTDYRAENEELKARVTLLEQEVERLNSYGEENKKLTELLELKQKYSNIDTTGASVIAKDPGIWYDSFVLNKGSRDEVKAEMCITTPKGLVGYIYESGYTYSKAISILDNRSSVSSKNLRTNDIGVVKGDYSLMASGLCRMDYVDADADIAVGDEIVTSHLSDIYPEGITIGFVKEVYQETNGLTKYAVIEPSVDFKHLDSVLILKNTINKEE